MPFVAIRLHYLLVYAVVGAYMPYLPVFLGRDLGMPDSQIGWVAGIYGLSVVLSPPLVTYLADRRFTGRTLIGLGLALSAVGLVGLASASRFVPVLLVSFAFATVFTPLFALIDGLAFAAMAREQEAGRKHPAYEQLRVWGSLGFMLPAFVLFFVLKAGAASGRAAILAAAVAAGIGLVCVPLLPRVPPPARERDVPRGATWQVLRARPTRDLVIPLTLLFSAIAIFYAFYAPLVLAVGIDAEWVGLVMNLGVVAELPFMLAGGPLLRRFSLRSLALLGAACLTLRMALLAAVPDPIVTIASQLLHGPVVVALYLIPPMYLNLKASPGVRNHVQGLHVMLCYGLARVLGSVIGGYAADLALALAFALAAALAALAWLWLWLRFHDPEVDAILRPRETPVSKDIRSDLSLGTDVPQPSSSPSGT
ncbi:MFS transporter [Nannocystis sp.]|uniref:MFS transporter n=1 Tax=Nannocystis sp. TaxID=1962667 RepID=UPI0024249D63|nr:MFS transporter [Nannocystis sp.]MBK7824753.1 MFS transporter [Nannocystis sp.]MBK9752996.1 MFS transporter [Nannocystis sp.]